MKGNLLFFFFFLTILSKSWGTTATEEDKLLTIKNLPISSQLPNVYRFDNTTYWKYAIKAPRPYQLLILFSTTDYARCPACQQINQAFVNIATLFKSNQLPDNIIFTFVDMLEVPDISMLHQLYSLPFIASLTQKSLTKRGKSIFFKSDDLIDQSLFYRMNTVEYMTEKLLDWINLKTDQHASYKNQTSINLSQVFYIFCILLLLIQILIKLTLLVQRYPVLVPIGGVLLFLFSITGTFYCLQHHSHFMGIDTITGKRTIVDPSGRSQYLFEGYFSSGINILFAMSLYFLPKISRLNQKDSGSWKRYITFIIACAIVLLLLVTYLHIFHIKYSWVHANFLPPHWYTTGPLKFDRFYHIG